MFVCNSLTLIASLLALTHASMASVCVCRASTAAFKV